MWLRKQKKLKSFRFHCANKIDNYNRGGKTKEKRIQKNPQNKSKHKNNKCFSWVTAVRVLFLAGCHNSPHHCADLWTCCGGSSDSNLGPAPSVRSYQNWCAFCWARSQCPLCFPQTQRPSSSSCGVNLQLVWLVGRFGVFFLSHHCPWVSTVVLFPPLHVGCPLGFASEAAREDLGLPLWGPGVEVGQLLVLQGFWQHRVLRGSWRLGQQEI